MLGRTLTVMVALNFRSACTEGKYSYLLMDDTKPATVFFPTETNVSLVRFYLWTRESNDMNDFDELYVGDEDSILTSCSYPQKKTKILAHGFTSNGMDNFVTGTTEAYLNKVEKQQMTDTK